MYKGYEDRCSVCGSQILMFGCSDCIMRNFAVEESRLYVVGSRVVTSSFKGLSGAPEALDRGLYRKPPGVPVQVVSREDTAEAIEVEVCRVSDSSRFRITFTKPGPWKMRKRLIRLP